MGAGILLVVYVIGKLPKVLGFNENLYRKANWIILFTKMSLLHDKLIKYP